MNTYTPPCEIHDDEDFTFQAVVEDFDEDTGAIDYLLYQNVRCGDCFLRHQCVSAIMSLIQEKHGANESEVILEGEKSFIN